MDSITSIKQKVNTEAINSDKIIKLLWVPKRGQNFRGEF